MRVVLRGSAARRRQVGVAACVLVAALTGGCGPAAEHAAGAPSPAVPSTSAPGSAAPSTAPALSAAADLVASSNGRPASLDVTVTSVQQGVPGLSTPTGTVAEDCQLSPDGTEYATVTVVFTDRAPATKQEGVSSNLRLDLAVPDDSGLGVFVTSLNPTTSCDGTSVLPSQDTVQSQNLANERQTMTAYVVARRGPGDADPLQGVTLQMLDPRRNPDDISSTPWTWDIADLTAGAACPGVPNSICLPLT
jgi:hypothetical protein